MAYKDKAKRNEYQRNLMRRRRSANAGDEALAQEGEAKESERWRTFRMEEAEDLRRIVAAAMEQLENSDVDPVVKARAIFQGAQVSIKLLELTDLAKRVKELQDEKDE